MRTSLLAIAATVAALALTPAAGALGSASATHGQLLHVRANTNQSSNWFGYNQGTLEKNTTFFTSITGDWTVPAATRHTAGRTNTRPTGSASAVDVSTRVATSATTR